jgi:hypothetical protein
MPPAYVLDFKSGNFNLIPVLRPCYGKFSLITRPRKVSSVNYTYCRYFWEEEELENKELEEELEEIESEMKSEEEKYL